MSTRLSLTPLLANAGHPCGLSKTEMLVKGNRRDVLRGSIPATMARMSRRTSPSHQLGYQRSTDALPVMYPIDVDRVFDRAAVAGPANRVSELAVGRETDHGAVLVGDDNWPVGSSLLSEPRHRALPRCVAPRCTPKLCSRSPGRAQRLGRSCSSASRICTGENLYNRIVMSRSARYSLEELVEAGLLLVRQSGLAAISMRSGSRRRSASRRWRSTV